MHNFKLKVLAPVGALIIVASTSLALAHGGATGIVKERMDLMASVGKSMKTITEMFQGDKLFDPEAVRKAGLARSLREANGKISRSRSALVRRPCTGNWQSESVRAEVGERTPHSKGTCLLPG
jgi:cytochrome c556